MTRQRYVPSDNQWLDEPEFDSEAFKEAVFSELGERIAMEIGPNGTIHLDPSALPDGISENDAKRAIRDNHPHR